MTPKVSIICLCYNHSRFIEEAVESVFRQTYLNFEIIIIDDASQDNSKEVIERLCRKYTQIKFIPNGENMGMCKSFNKGLSISTGEFIIDLAGDDVLFPQRIEKQVNAFQQLDDSYGVVYSNAMMMNEKGESLGTFYRQGSGGELLERVIEGNVFSKVVTSYHICSPTIMMKKKVLNDLGGYDPSLSYEDYDFFIRSSRYYKYHFINEVLTGKRDVKGSDSYSWFKRKHNLHLTSTLKIHKKYLWLCKNEDEINAGLSSIRYHMRQSLFMECYSLCIQYFELLKGLNKYTFMDRVIYSIAKTRLPLYYFYNIYKKML
jgi:glycosyltransferase involved in cell wall biosynthesis